MSRSPRITAYPGQAPSRREAPHSRVEHPIVVRQPYHERAEVKGVLVSAIAEASAWLPPLVVAQQMGAALKIDNLDEVLGDLTDDQGNFIDPVAPANAKPAVK